ncbi:hypothetical protein [Vibrio crassostreae]|uniref:hypothetical protein n=1 Tax=Vibrio crassostreae TaxID=246167 RepID=UPI001B302414|nr:hypothetical protein [Vibrio crassostreae]
MARCTAPSRGHRSAAAAANCPACGGRYSRYGSGGYSSYSTSSYSPSRISSSETSSSKKPSWSKSGSSVSYTSAQIQSLTPIRETVETRAAQQPDLRDVFLCHAWGDRKDAAKELHDLLEAAGPYLAG